MNSTPHALHLTVEATSRTERRLMQEADRRVAARPLEGVRRAIAAGTGSEDPHTTLVSVPDERGGEGAPRLGSDPPHADLGLGQPRDGPDYCARTGFQRILRQR